MLYPISSIQIQHLLKLNLTHLENFRLQHYIQIQHLLKLNLQNSSNTGHFASIQIQHLLKLNWLMVIC